MIFCLYHLFFSGCTLQEKKESTGTCENSTECVVGSMCAGGFCIEAECFYSEDCPYSSYCTEDYQCVEGCQNSADCIPGYACEQNLCVEQGCRDSQLDCRIGEICTESECILLEPSPCENCSYSDWLEGLGEERECIIYSYDLSVSCDWSLDSGCPSGMSCYPADGLGQVEEGVCIYSYAMYRCSSTQDCPRGFHCLEDVYQNESGINVCWANCKQYIEEGWM
ncbi:MAG: hypothetical protein VX278_18510 [Myxococcota bacterium]|nr:hypothetical protein [Myxococcota bacterium]